jgi:hypothetical protein
LALNLHIVLTALVIWFLRWQIRNSKLQVGRLLAAGTLIAEVTGDGKGEEAKAMYPCSEQSSWAHRKRCQKGSAEIVFPVQEALI